MTTDEALAAAEELGERVLENPEDLLKPVATPGQLGPQRAGRSVASMLSSKSPLSKADVEARLEMQKNLIQLDTQVQSCTAIGVPWLEYDPKVIAHLNGGELPKANYVIYKNIFLFVPNTLADIIKAEKHVVNEYVYVQDGELFVGEI